MRFRLAARKERTKVWVVENISSGGRLGSVEWSGPWRQYVFFPMAETVFNGGCLGDLRLFLDSRNADHQRELLAARASKPVAPQGKKVDRRELRRDLRALGERYAALKDSEKPEDKEEATRLLTLHENIRQQLME